MQSVLFLTFLDGKRQLHGIQAFSEFSFFVNVILVVSRYLNFVM
jgi:hypothetical protein